MRKKYLKGIVAGMMVGAVVLTNGQIVSAKSDYYYELKHNFGSIYDGDKAQEYAISFCGKYYGKDSTTEGYNSKTFHTFNKDCTNFVSQCVAKGGMVQVDDKKKAKDDQYMYYPDGLSEDPYWYSCIKDGKWKATNTWADTDRFEYYMRKLRGITCHRTTDLKFVRNNAAVGDVIQFIDGTGDVRHSMIVTKVYNGEVYMAGHTYNYKYRSLEEAYSSAKKSWGKGTFINLMKFTQKYK